MSSAIFAVIRAFLQTLSSRILTPKDGITGRTMFCGITSVHGPVISSTMYPTVLNPNSRATSSSDTSHRRLKSSSTQLLFLVKVRFRTGPWTAQCCQENLGSFSQYIKRVGKHLEQLKLFALPNAEEDIYEDEEGGNGEDGDDKDEEHDSDTEDNEDDDGNDEVGGDGDGDDKHGNDGCALQDRGYLNDPLWGPSYVLRSPFRSRTQENLPRSRCSSGVRVSRSG